MQLELYLHILSLCSLPGFWCPPAVGVEGNVVWDSVLRATSLSPSMCTGINDCELQAATISCT